MLFPALDGVPADQHRLRILFRGGAAEYVGVAEDQLLHHAVHHVLHGEPAPLALNVRVEHHLHQYVPQLLLQKRGVVPVNGLGGLIGLLQKPPADGRVGLHLIPGAALRRAENADDLQQVAVVVSVFLSKMYHIPSPIASPLIGKIAYEGSFS